MASFEKIISEVIMMVRDGTDEEAHRAIQNVAKMAFDVAYVAGMNTLIISDMPQIVGSTQAKEAAWVDFEQKRKF